MIPNRDPQRSSHSNQSAKGRCPSGTTGPRQRRGRSHVAPRGKLLMVLRFTIANGKIIEIEAVADPKRLNKLDLALLND